MPDTVINFASTNTPVRFEAGGIFRITDGATDYALQNRNRGSLRVKQGGYEILTFRNLGLNQIPLEGDEKASRVECELKLWKNETTGIRTLIAARNTSGASQGLMKTYTVVISYLNVKGGSTGFKFTFTNAYFLPEECEITEGQDFDTIKVVMESTNPLFAEATV